MDINFLVCNVIIATQNKTRIFFLQFFQVNIKFIQPLIFKSLPDFTGSAGGEICIDQSYIAKIKLDNPSFVITHLMTCAILDMLRFYFCQYGYSAVSFFLCTEPKVLITQ